MLSHGLELDKSVLNALFPRWPMAGPCSLRLFGWSCLTIPVGYQHVILLQTVW